jgi:cyclophilin family peptidyl-prolyl cis-trans isomerase/HEAT repeat protein
MKTLVRITLAAALLAACAPFTGNPTAGGLNGRGVSEAGLLRLADRREFDEGYLRMALAHRNPAVARRAAWTLANLRRPDGVPLLGRALAHRDTSVAAMAAFSLGQIADSSAVPLLLPYADAARAERTPTVVAEVAYALGKIRHADARAALERLLTTLSADGPGNNAAVRAALLAVWRQGRPTPVNAIDPWIRHADPEVRWRAAYALARRPEPAAAAALFRAADDSEALVRSFVARGLTAAMADSGGIGQDAAQRALLRMVREDAAEIVRINALRSLGTYRTAETVGALTHAASVGPPYESITAMESLQRLGTFAAASTDVLRQRAMDRDVPVFIRQTALAALAEVDPRQAVQVAEEVAEEPGWRLRASAARALAQAEGTRRLFTYAPDRDGRVAAAALDEALTLAGDTAVESLRGLLVPALGHRDVIVRTNALTGMARLADTATLPILLDSYQRAQADSINDAALAAVDAIGAVAKKNPAAAARFFARFPRSRDYLVRQRVATAFGDSAQAAWDDPLPIETEVTDAEYARIVRETRARPRPHAVIETDKGEIELELFADDAPLTVRSFLGLASAGFFNGQEWPRVVPNFVIQGGDPRGDTSGGPGYSIRDEINRHLYLRGSLGMALSGPDTGGSQWFVTHSPQPHLDGTYTVFGRVVRGMEVADRILPGDRIIRIREVR